MITTIWMVLCGAMVLFMQAGFAMLETGFARAKNAGNIVMKNIMDLCIASPLFICIGYGLMYGKGNGFIGKLDLTLAGEYTSVLPEGVGLYGFVFFGLAFCATAATIVSGAMAERTRFSAYCIYSAVISVLVFPIVGHWIWGGGWLSEVGFHDFAGGTVVHMVGGVSAFVGAWILGPRIGKYSKKGKSKAIPGHNITLAALGVFILWFGWYGFNGGSVLTSGNTNYEKLGGIFLNTAMCPAVAAFFAMLTSRVKYKKADISMTINGILSGLVAITAGCDCISPFGAIVVGAVTGVILVHAIGFIDKVLKVDDPVGAIAAHGVCGMLGTWMCGLLSVEKGLFYTGKPEFFLVQVLGSFAVGVFVFAVMWIAFKLIDLTVGLRVEPEVEREGLDVHEHGLKSAYGDFLTNEYVDVLEDVQIAKISEAIGNISVEKAVPVTYSGQGAAPEGKNCLTKVEIIVKESKFELLKEAMNQIGVTGMTVTKVLGCGMQKGVDAHYRGSEVAIHLLPKIKVEIVLAKVPVKTVVETARKVLYTGHIGDGKIFVYDVRDAIKIRTGAVGYDAMQGLQD